MIKYYPEDSSEDFGFIGIRLPMNGNKSSSNGGFFNMSRTTEEQAVSNYINLLLTRKGERYMQPDFGVGIQYKLFEPNTDAVRLDIESEIQRQAAFWLPYIFNKSIEVKPKADIPGISNPENTIQIIITFSVTDQGANRQIVIFQLGGKTNIEIN